MGLGDPLWGSPAPYFRTVLEVEVLSNYGLLRLGGATRRTCG
ncbi:hypothetical protein GCM10025782_01350 [Pedococcus ginsenosidimutans]|uniref:Uncharacterized protein n=1 Tax=Pedococcus ginsenosidimutans TaxID=490570 RepID=A0ABP8XMW7_9MICO